jgi:pSer/pThr/pTyr-binding forkhead associated (FHA) protein
MTIRCSQGHENPEGSAFCDECGERLPQPGADAATVPAAVPPMSSAVAVAAPATTAQLIVASDNFTFPLTGKSEWVVGREDPVSNIYPDLDLTEHGGEEGGVSRLHAKVYQSGGQYSIEDQNSTNFTFVNRQKLAPKTPQPLNDGDEIRFGRVVVKFQSM